MNFGIILFRSEMTTCEYFQVSPSYCLSFKKCLIRTKSVHFVRKRLAVISIKVL